MSQDTHEEGAKVLDLTCARYEDALAEGEVPTPLRDHPATCARCASLEADITRLSTRLREATGPVAVDPGFAAQVYERMGDMVGAPLEREPRRRERPWLYVALPAAAAVAVFVAYYGLQGQQGVSNTPVAVHQSALDLPAGSARLSPGHKEGGEDAAPAVKRVEMVPQRTLSTPGAPGDSVAPIQILPEHTVDVARELRQALLRQTTSLAGCPKHSPRPVTLTVTVATNGQLSNRQILSSAEAKDAHSCVAAALDTLLLPPLAEATTVTLELRW